MSDFRTILLALDGSRRAEGALPHALSLATMPNARVLLVQAVRARALPGDDGELERQSQCGTARSYLADIAARAHDVWPALRVGVSVPLGVPADAILDEAVLAHADVIVMSSHGGGTSPWHCFGRTVAEVLRRTEVPVLLVPTNLRQSAPTWSRPADVGSVREPAERLPATTGQLPV